MSTLTRRELLALSSLPWTTGARAAESSTMMRDSLLHKLDDFDERRRRHLSAIQTKGDIARLQTEVRRVMHTCFGAFPERTPSFSGRK